MPQVNPDGDSDYDLSDSDFLLVNDNGAMAIDPTENPGLLYPYGRVNMHDANQPGESNALLDYPSVLMDESHFSEIPGLGPALKFTFTLYDSKGLIPGGRTFTHIVYLDD